MCEMIHDGLMQTLKNSSTRHHLSMMSLGFHSCPLPPPPRPSITSCCQAPLRVCVCGPCHSAPLDVLARAFVCVCWAVVLEHVHLLASPSFLRLVNSFPSSPWQDARIINISAEKTGLSNIWYPFVGVLENKGIEYLKWHMFMWPPQKWYPKKMRNPKIAFFMKICV